MESANCKPGTTNPSPIPTTDVNEYAYDAQTRKKSMDRELDKNCSGMIGRHHSFPASADEREAHGQKRGKGVPSSGVLEQRLVLDMRRRHDTHS
jgi:hypothetical protein